MLHTLSYQPEAFVQERNTRCRPSWRLAGSPPFFLIVQVSPLLRAEAVYRPMRCAHDGVPTQGVLRGSSEVRHVLASVLVLSILPLHVWAVFAYTGPA